MLTEILNPKELKDTCGFKRDETLSVQINCGKRSSIYCILLPNIKVCTSMLHPGRSWEKLGVLALSQAIIKSFKQHFWSLRQLYRLHKFPSRKAIKTTQGSTWVFPARCPGVSLALCLTEHPSFASCCLSQLSPHRLQRCPHLPSASVNEQNLLQQGEQGTVYLVRVEFAIFSGHSGFVHLMPWGGWPGAETGWSWRIK